MRVTMMLCDHAQVAGGKLFISGGGWSIAAPTPQPSAIALLIAVPWDQADQRTEFSVVLVDEDGQVVEQPGSFGSQALRTEGYFEVGRPVGILPGTPLDVPIAILLPALVVAPGAYTWRLTLNGEIDEDWRLPFTIPPKPHPQSDLE